MRAVPCMNPACERPAEVRTSVYRQPIGNCCNACALMSLSLEQWPLSMYRRSLIRRRWVLLEEYR